MSVGQSTPPKSVKIVVALSKNRLSLYETKNEVDESTPGASYYARRLGRGGRGDLRGLQSLS